MKTIKPTTELETELLAVAAELTLENSRLKVALEDSEKLRRDQRQKDKDDDENTSAAFVEMQKKIHGYLENRSDEFEKARYAGLRSLGKSKSMTTNWDEK